MKNTVIKYLMILSALLISINVSADDKDWSSLAVKKTVVPSTTNTGAYTITLESFLKGSEIPGESTHPDLDVVLVLDDSGSMSWGIENIRSSQLDTEKGKLEGYYGYSSGNSENAQYFSLRYANNRWEYRQTGTNKDWKQVQNISSISNLFKSRIGSLLEGCNNFIDILAQDCIDNQANHRVSIVKFSSEHGYNWDGFLIWGEYKDKVPAGALLKDLTSVSTTSGVNSVKSVLKLKSDSYENAATGFIADGATYAEAGLAKAIEVMNNARTDAKKVVVMFTDGAPTHNSNFESSVANDAIVNSKSLKDAGATVYSINVYPGSGTNEHKYMNYVSSNYPNATGWNYTTSDNKETTVYGYYKFASNADELSSAFADIAGDAVTSVMEVEASKTTVVDQLTEQFILPDGINHPENIKVYVAPLTGYNADGNTDATKYIFGTRQINTTSTLPEDIRNLTPSLVNVTKTVNGVETTYQTIKLNGFDFTKYWCGSLADGTPRTDGKKLIIEFDVIPNPDAEGGYVGTNTQDSGIYYNENQVESTDGEEVLEFQNDYKTFVPIDLTVTLNGLNKEKTETIIFNISRKSGSIEENNFIQVAISVDDLDAQGNLATTIAKLDVKDADGNLYEYNVTVANWNWAYEVTSAPTPSKFYKRVNDEEYEEVVRTDGSKGHQFNFVVAEKVNTEKHDEVKINNKFQ